LKRRPNYVTSLWKFGVKNKALLVLKSSVSYVNIIKHVKVLQVIRQARHSL
jgi:hypothetical protein